MKVYLGKYRPHISLQGTVDSVFWFLSEQKREQIGDWLYYKDPPVERHPGEIYSLLDRSRRRTRLARIFFWVSDAFSKTRISYVKIDRWDTWSMDYTLAKIILPMLLHYKEHQYGHPYGIDEPECPEDLTKDAEKWAFIIDEMIFAFSCILDDEWDSEFLKDLDEPIMVQKLENGCSRVIPSRKDTIDYEGLYAKQARIRRGLLFFGKYYQSLWN